MCQRFSLTADLADLQQYFHLDAILVPYRSRYNIAPTQSIPVILNDEGRKTLDEFRWGLIPFWAKDAVNADSDAIHEKRAFRRLFAKNRCVIPCSGFYLWKKVGKINQPVRVVLRSRGVFGIAGLYDIWRDPRGKEYRTCTLLTTRPNRLVAEYEDRMPVILNELTMKAWLTPGKADADYLQAQLRPYPEGDMLAYTVSTMVSNINNELPECVEEVRPNYAMIKE